MDTIRKKRRKKKKEVRGVENKTHQLVTIIQQKYQVWSIEDLVEEEDLIDEISREELGLQRIKLRKVSKLKWSRPKTN